MKPANLRAKTKLCFYALTIREEVKAFKRTVCNLMTSILLIYNRIRNNYHRNMINWRIDFIDVTAVVIHVARQSFELFVYSDSNFVSPRTNTVNEGIYTNEWCKMCLKKISKNTKFNLILTTFWVPIMKIIISERKQMSRNKLWFCRKSRVALKYNYKWIRFVFPVITFTFHSCKLKINFKDFCLLLKLHAYCWKQYFYFKYVLCLWSEGVGIT